MNNQRLIQLMEECKELAFLSSKDPNLRKPYVGAVVVTEEGEVVGRGYKKFLPGTKLIVHAEREALDNARRRTRGNTLITTLEPCAKFGKNKSLLQPCSSLIAERGIIRVVFGCYDTLMDGAGERFLKDRGIEGIYLPVVDFSLLGRNYKYPLEFPKAQNY